MRGKAQDAHFVCFVSLRRVSLNSPSGKRWMERSCQVWCRYECEATRGAVHWDVTKFRLAPRARIATCAKLFVARAQRCLRTWKFFRKSHLKQREVHLLRCRWWRSGVEI